MRTGVPCLQPAPERWPCLGRADPVSMAELEIRQWAPKHRGPHPLLGLDFSPTHRPLWAQRPWQLILWSQVWG